MKRAKFYKCELCGVEVFKTYFSGDIKIGELSFYNGDVKEIYHYCYFDHSISSQNLKTTEDKE